MGLNAKQWGALFIAGLFALSIVGFIGVGNSNTITGATTSNNLEYNGHTFTKNGDYWQIIVDNTYFYFTNPPSALEVFEIPANLPDILNNDKIYIASDPTQSLDLSSLRFYSVSFFSNFNTRSFEACTQEEACSDIPIIDCSNDHAIIFIQDDDLTEIQVDQNCIAVFSTNIETMLRQLERIFYHSLRIMS